MNEILLLDARINRGQFVLVGSRSCLGAPVFPVGFPGHEPILLVVDAFVDLPIERLEPFQFHGVQLLHRNVADLGPRAVLESVVIKKLASQKQGCREHPIHLRTAGCVYTDGRELAHPACQVVETEQNSGAGETRRREDL